MLNPTRATAIELDGRGVLDNCVAPRSILTDGTNQLFYDAGGQFNDKMERLLAHIPLGRLGTCQEIGNAVLFLAALESSYITEQTLVVNSGWMAGWLF